MKLIALNCIVLILTAFPCFAQKPEIKPVLFSPPTKSALKEFVSVEDNFKAVFPGQPIVSKGNLKNVAQTKYTVTGAATMWNITVYKFEYEVEKFGKQYLEVYQKGLTEPGPQKVLAERWTSFENSPVYEADVLTNDQFERLRLYMFSNKLYHVSLVVRNWPLLEKQFKEKAKEFENETTRFFDSFNFVSPRIVEPEPTYNEFFGEVKDEIYENKFFQFTVKLPKKWKKDNFEEIEDQNKFIKELLKNNDGKISERLLDSFNKNFALLSVSDENLKNAKGLSFRIAATKQPNQKATAADVAKITAKNLSDSASYKLLEIVDRIEKNGQTFARTKYEITFEGNKVYILSYILMRKGYALDFSLGFQEQSDFSEVEKIFDTLELK